MTEITYPLFALSRLRMGSDGAGVATLAAAKGCPLRCRLCLNPQCLRADAPVRHITPEALYEAVRVDDLYFQATGGGVTFGGGEPLLHAEFIRRFRAVCGGKWRLTAETCLNIDERELEIAMGCLDGFIVDIKDLDPDIYSRYTGVSNAPVIRNLKRLLSEFDPERVLVRVPHIPGYNTPGGVQRSLETLAEWGAVHTDVFTYIHPDK